MKTNKITGFLRQKEVSSTLSLLPPVDKPWRSHVRHRSTIKAAWSPCSKNMHVRMQAPMTHRGPISGAA